MIPSRPISAQQVAVLERRLREQELPRITVSVARSTLARVQGASPRAYKQFVDGHEGAPLDSVRPGGSIRFVFANLGPVVEWIYLQLVQRSPVGPPELRHLGDQVHYRDVHWLFIDDEPGRPMRASGTITVKRQAMFCNARPYARRLEHGWSLQAPDGVYELVAIEAQRRWPDVPIEFRYLGPGEVPAPIPWRVQPYYRYPSITVRADSPVPASTLQPPVH